LAGVLQIFFSAAGDYPSYRSRCRGSGCPSAA